MERTSKTDPPHSWMQTQCHPTLLHPWVRTHEKRGFSIQLYPAQLLGSCSFSSGINNIFHCHVANRSNNSKITKNISCNLPSAILLHDRDVIFDVTVWVPSIGSIHETLQCTRGFMCGAKPKRGSIHGCAPRLNAPLD